MFESHLQPIDCVNLVFYMNSCGSLSMVSTLVKVATMGSLQFLRPKMLFNYNFTRVADRNFLHKGAVGKVFPVLR